jgi:periplasmic protein TonB
MKTKASASETWDDLVFENRHKDYGAYAVRQHYSQNMTAGLGVSVSIAALLVMLPRILALFGVDDKIIDALPVISDFGDVVIIDPPPIIEPPVTPPSAAASQPINTNNVTPQVTTTAPMETTITPNSEIVTSYSEPGTGDGPPVEGITNGTGVVEAVVPITPPIQIFDGAEVMPQYDGGLQALARFIQRKVRTPRSVSSQGVSGTVFVQFVVRSDGSITDVMVVRGIAADCDREAVRLVSLMKDWSPGMQNKIPVSVRMVLPIKFTSEPSNF